MELIRFFKVCDKDKDIVGFRWVGKEREKDYKFMFVVYVYLRLSIIFYIFIVLDEFCEIL